MTTSGNVSAIRRFWQGFNTHNLDIWDEVCAPAFINHDPGLPTPDADLPTIKQTIAGLLFGAFPDLQAVEQDLIAEGDKVATRLLMHGTHQGEFMGIAPTGKPVTFAGVWLAHLSGGQITEQWVYFDALGLLQQVGAVPAPGAGGSGSG
jgi:ketosteroid isomerase-like protein